MSDDPVRALLDAVDAQLATAQADDPQVTTAFLTDVESGRDRNPPLVLLAVARPVASFVLTIPAAEWDATKVLLLLGLAPAAPRRRWTDRHRP